MKNSKIGNTFTTFMSYMCNTVLDTGIISMYLLVRTRANQVSSKFRE